jgi:hypothetical protein
MDLRQLLKENRIPAKWVQKRLDICDACDKYQKKIYRCAECGCIVPLKVRVKKTECPLDKWGEELL